VKGRAACCIESADSILSTELMISADLGHLGPAELAGVASCLLPHRAASLKATASDASWLQGVGDEVMAAVRRLRQCACEIAAAADADAAGGDGGDGGGGGGGGGGGDGGGGAESQVSAVLLRPALLWARGGTFCEVSSLAKADMYEGALVFA